MTCTVFWLDLTDRDLQRRELALEFPYVALENVQCKNEPTLNTPSDETPQQNLLQRTCALSHSSDQPDLSNCWPQKILRLLFSRTSADPRGRWVTYGLPCY